ncbi:T9SS type A sorting domain-containing protein [Bizionia myxarmorum]|uniref:T9SS type A sorting domain-containing protein n=1 Tax=Bizionia myxarmorum TaxID=291186 RepID=A0A5D0RBK4_9FLAO|nr:T9SS type A sorting domain-containing protein [Bizionia myxarmorum]TYB78225.1 T9SS type A sorting domain-containing protein [Bizionia myxarmorum]
MIKNFLLLCLSVLCSTSGIAQNPKSDSVENKYLNYFNLQPETIYTQVNKSKYLKSEELWFKSYIYNTQTQKPYITTSNVYASIYNADGQLVEKKIYYAENGVTHGNFNLKENYEPGIYFLKVSTNWMKNFNDPNYSLQQFEVLGSETDFNSVEKTDQKYDFQLLPEGGHLLENTKNTIGFKARNANGEPLIIKSGKVLDSKKNTISTFESNEFGIGKFSVILSENESYYVEATVDDGSIITEKIAKPEAIGLALSVNTLNQNMLFIIIKTNKKTLPYLLDKPHYLLIHRDGLLKKIDIRFEAETLDYTLAVPKQELYSGMNILTVFNEKDQAILERLVFHKTENLTEDMSLLGKKVGNDSTQIRLKSSKANRLKKTISVSVLPTSTESYSSNNTIISAFLLKPYIKGDIENARAYFTSNDSKTNYNLDLLLLTQGWSRYEWQDIFNKPQIDKYAFEAGFQLQGKVDDENVSDFKEMVLFSPKNEIMLTADVKDSLFSFDRLFLTNDAILSLSAKNKKDKLINPKVYYNLYPTYIVDSINTEKAKKKQIKLVVNNTDFIYDDSFTELDTVMLDVKKYEKKEKFMPTGGVNNRNIDLKTVYSFSTRILEVIGSNGFDIIDRGGENITILARRSPNLQGRLSPEVYLDGVLVSGQLYLIFHLTVSDVEELYIAKTGYGIDGSGGTINIFKKGGGTSKSRLNSNFISNDIKIGFSAPKSYYSPLYNTSKREIFSKLGVLNWISNVEANENGEFVFKVPNYFYESVNLYIEGMSEDGSLISKVESIQLK